MRKTLRYRYVAPVRQISATQEVCQFFSLEYLQLDQRDSSIQIDYWKYDFWRYLALESVRNSFQNVVMLWQRQKQYTEIFIGLGLMELSGTV